MHPLPSKNGPGGPCDPLPDTKKQKKKPRNFKPVSKRARTTALPGPSLGRGAGSTTRGYASYDDGSAPSSWCEKAAKHNRRGKQKQQRETTKTPLPPRVQKRASEGVSELKPRKFQENPKNVRGPEWHPGKTPRSGTHGQNGRTNKCGGTKKRNRKKQPKCVWGCALLLPKLSLFKRKNKNKKATTSAKNQRKREKNPQTPDLTSREFFRDISGSEKPKNNAKT